MPVSWPTVIWSMVAAASLTMALPYLVIGTRQRGERVYLFFALAGFAVAWLATAEISVMLAVTTQESGRALQLGQAAMFILVSAIIGFVWLYFGTARPWLGLLAGGLRALSLVINFAFPPNLNFLEVTALRSFSFLGETVSRPVGPGNPWIFLGYASSILLLAFVIDASVRLWRQGTPDGRRRAVTVGGGIVFFIVAAQSVSVLVNVGKINLPYVSCIPFLAIVVAMGFELTYDVIRAAQLSRALQASSAALRESEERMSLATESARLSLWEWDVARGEIWMTAEGRSLLGFKPEEPLNYAALAGRVHPEDRAARETAIQRALETRGSYEMEYRVLGPDGAVRWIAARGRCTRADNVAAPRLLGVSLDITRQKLADAEMRQQRDDLGHLGRVALVGEMATSLAHELNQPLTAIVTNASTAKKILARGELKPGDLRELLADIAADGSRASEVIRGIKDMVRKVPSERHAVNLNEVIANALRLVRPDALTSDCTLATDLVPALPAVTGDAVQLQQVLLNLVVNALDAIRQTPATPRRIEISSRLVDGEFVEISVRDTGPGLPAGSPGRVFDRFFSTKPEGMGMGLAIARSIIEAHNGTLQAENTASEAARTKGYLPSQLRGARFWFRLPVRVAALVEVKA